MKKELANEWKAINHIAKNGIPEYLLNKIQSYNHLDDKDFSNNLGMNVMLELKDGQRLCFSFIVDDDDHLEPKLAKRLSLIKETDQERIDRHQSLINEDFRIRVKTHNFKLAPSSPLKSSMKKRARASSRKKKVKFAKLHVVVDHKDDQHGRSDDKANWQSPFDAAIVDHACNFGEPQLSAISDDVMQQLSAESPAKVHKIPHYEIHTKVQQNATSPGNQNLSADGHQRKSPVPNNSPATNGHFTTINVDDLNKLKLPIAKNSSLFKTRVLATSTVSSRNCHQSNQNATSSINTRNFPVGSVFTSSRIVATANVPSKRGYFNPELNASPSEESCIVQPKESGCIPDADSSDFRTCFKKVSPLVSKRPSSNPNEDNVMYLANKRKINKDANQTGKSMRTPEQQDDGLNEIYGLRKCSAVKQWLNSSEEKDASRCESLEDSAVSNSIGVEGCSAKDINFNSSFESQDRKTVEKSLSESSLRNSKRLSEMTERSRGNQVAEEVENVMDRKSARKSRYEPRVSEKTRSEFNGLLKEGNEILRKEFENKLKRNGESAERNCDEPRENERLNMDLSKESSGESAGKTGNEARERPNADFMDLFKDSNVLLYENADKLMSFQEHLRKYPGIYDKNSNPTAECTLSYVEINQ